MRRFRHLRLRGDAMGTSARFMRGLVVAGLVLGPLSVLPAAVSAAVVHEGDFDGDFGDGGRVRASFVSNGNDEAHAVAIAPGGKIVVAGLTYNAARSGYNMGVVRLNPDGTFDTTFNHG